MKAICTGQSRRNRHERRVARQIWRYYRPLLALAFMLGCCWSSTLPAQAGFAAPFVPYKSQLWIALYVAIGLFAIIAVWEVVAMVAVRHAEEQEATEAEASIANDGEATDDGGLMSDSNDPFQALLKQAGTPNPESEPRPAKSSDPAITSAGAGTKDATPFNGSATISVASGSSDATAGVHSTADNRFRRVDNMGDENSKVSQGAAAVPASRLSGINAAGTSAPVSMGASIPASAVPAGGSKPISMSSPAGPKPLSAAPSGGPKPFGMAPSDGPKPLGMAPSDGPKPFGMAPSDGPKPLGMASSDGPKPLGMAPSDGPKPLGMAPSGGPKPLGMAPSGGPKPLGMAPSGGPKPLGMAPSDGPKPLGVASPGAPKPLGVAAAVSARPIERGESALNPATMRVNVADVSKPSAATVRTEASVSAPAAGFSGSATVAVRPNLAENKPAAEAKGADVAAEREDPWKKLLGQTGSRIGAAGSLKTEAGANPLGSRSAAIPSKVGGSAGPVANDPWKALLNNAGKGSPHSPRPSVASAPSPSLSLDVKKNGSPSDTNNVK